MNDQLELLTTAGTLAETTLDQRLAGALAVLDAEPDLPPDQRLDLLGLVIGGER